MSIDTAEVGRDEWLMMEPLPRGNLGFEHDDTKGVAECAVTTLDLQGVERRAMCTTCPLLCASREEARRGCSVDR